jgi:hypothetical protein
MIDRSYFNTIQDTNINILHNSNNDNLTNILSNSYSKSEFNNLILNSNLDNSNIIK